MTDTEKLVAALAKSSFRSRFKLTDPQIDYIVTVITQWINTQIPVHPAKGQVRHHFHPPPKNPK